MEPPRPLDAPAAFPEETCRLRYRRFDPRLPCGAGCLYNCCDPVITCFNIEDGPDLALRLEGVLPERRRDLLQQAPFLEFAALSLPELPETCGIDTARPPAGRLQVNLLWRCPHLEGGLCAIHGQPRPPLCTDYNHCPEQAVARTGAGSLAEETFVTLARAYWGLRGRVLACAAATGREALARREMKDKVFF